MMSNDDPTLLEKTEMLYLPTHKTFTYTTTPAYCGKTVEFGYSITIGHYFASVSTFWECVAPKKKKKIDISFVIENTLGIFSFFN